MAGRVRSFRRRGSEHRRDRGRPRRSGTSPRPSPRAAPSNAGNPSPTGPDANSCISDVARHNTAPASRPARSNRLHHDLHPSAVARQCERRQCHLHPAQRADPAARHQRGRRPGGRAERALRARVARRHGDRRHRHLRPAAHGTYRLPPEHAASLTTPSGRDNLALFLRYIGLMGRVEDGVVEAFRSGGGWDTAGSPTSSGSRLRRTGRSTTRACSSGSSRWPPGWQSDSTPASTCPTSAAGRATPSTCSPAPSRAAASPGSTSRRRASRRRARRRPRSACATRPSRYRPHAVLDVNVPQWRYQLHGPKAILEGCQLLVVAGAQARGDAVDQRGLHGAHRPTATAPGSTPPASCANSSPNSNASPSTTPKPPTTGPPPDYQPHALLARALTLPGSTRHPLMRGDRAAEDAYAESWREEQRLMAEGRAMRVVRITWSRDDLPAR